MTAMTMTFEYTDSPQSGHRPENFVLLVPPGIRSKANLFAAYSDAGQFPGYFGHNWDALLDFLRDFSWIENRTVIIVHSDVPLLNSPPECRTYLEILQTAQADWSSPPKPNALPAPPEWPYVEHELRVVFPNAARATVSLLLGK